MSEFCEITGLSIDNANKYRFIHSKMLEEFSPQKVVDSNLEKYESQFQNLIRKILPHKSDQSRREKLTKHLERTLGKKFKAEEVKQFGSSISGLSIKGSDLDICLIIPDAKEKNTVFNIAKVLRGQGMENVKAIPKARVPVVNFSDPRSGLNVDISVNNTLAIHNTDLLKSYANINEMVRNLILIVKHWAFHRDISNSYEGTLSSYSWSILCLNYLISEKIVPNLQENGTANVIEINGIEYDISFLSESKSELPKDISLSKLVCGFFDFYSSWDWSTNVVSMKNGGFISREDKNWETEEPTSIDLLNAGKGKSRTGNYHLPIEDPLDHGHDLSRVLTADGELSVLNEILRTRSEIGNGTSWDNICETINPDRLVGLEPEDLFHDLRTLSSSDVDNMKSKVQGEINGLETKIKALEDEKSVAIRLANAMKGLLEETSDIRSEHKTIHIGLKERSKEIRDIRQQRDKINANIVIPLKYIEQNLERVYKKLTNELNFRYIPTLEEEIKEFSWFFELQEMHKKAIQAEQLHQKYVELSKLQHKDIKKLEIYENQHDEVTTKLLENEPLLKEANIGKHGVKSYDKRVYNINRAIHQRKGEYQKLRREIGRLDAWIRISKGGKQQKGGERATKSREKPISGPVTLGDLSNLLNQTNDSSPSKKPKKVSSKKAGMKKLGNLSAHRGSRKTYQRKD